MVTSGRWTTFFHALAFVTGFSAVFVILGASVAFVGYTLNTYLDYVVKVGGLIVILFGLYVSGILSWIADRLRAAGADRHALGRGYLAFVDMLARLMYTEGRVQARADPRWGYLSSFVMGVFFSAGWIPCIGPVLAVIYLLASDTRTVAQGAFLLLAYSAGLGIPFLLTGAALSTATGFLRRLNRHMGLISLITGLFLIVMGGLLFVGRLTVIANLITARLGTGFASVELGVMSGTAAVTAPIALAAGVLSFLSPCVLPLIPAYIGYLSGTAMAAAAARGESIGQGVQ